MTGRTRFGLLLLGLIACLILVDRVLDDGIMGELLLSLYGGDTVYSEHFSQGKFKQVRVGDSYETVSKLLREPIRSHEYNDDGEMVLVLNYSTGTSNGHYRQRSIFLKSGIVIKKVCKVHID